MDNVQILKNLDDVKLPKIPEDTFVIYKEGYEIPDIKCTEKFTFRQYKEEYHNLHINMLIIFGTNRIITPSNRTDFIFEHLFTLTNGTPKISVDYLPFIGEPWRCWFHYGITNSGNFGIPYSYTIETEWKHWFYRKRQDSRFQKDNLKICLTDTYCDLDQLKHEVQFYAPNDLDLEWYEEAKKFVFEKYHTPKMLVNNLLKMCNKKFNLDYDYDSYKSKQSFMLPEFNVYKFVSQEVFRRLDIYNCFITNK